MKTSILTLILVFTVDYRVYGAILGKLFGDSTCDLEPKWSHCSEDFTSKNGILCCKAFYVTNCVTPVAKEECGFLNQALIHKLARMSGNPSGDLKCDKELNGSLRCHIWYTIEMVSILWGTTTPLMRRYCIKEPGDCSNYLIRFFRNWKYIAALVTNQIGSVLFVVALKENELSLISPMVNAMTFFFTFFTGKLLGEETNSLRSYIGVGLILLGTSLCLLEKSL